MGSSSCVDTLQRPQGERPHQLVAWSHCHVQRYFRNCHWALLSKHSQAFQNIKVRRWCNVQGSSTERMAAQKAIAIHLHVTLTMHKYWVRDSSSAAYMPEGRGEREQGWANQPDAAQKKDCVCQGAMGSLVGSGMHAAWHRPGAVPNGPAPAPGCA